MNDNEIKERSAEIKGEEIAAREYERQREEGIEKNEPMVEEEYDDTPY